MNIENIEINKSKYSKKEGDLEKGSVCLTVKDMGMGIDLKNIPYRITKEKEVVVTAPGLNYSTPTESNRKLITFKPTVSFHDAAIWDAIVESIKKEIQKNLIEKEGEA